MMDIKTLITNQATTFSAFTQLEERIIATTPVQTFDQLSAIVGELRAVKHKVDGVYRGLIDQFLQQLTTEAPAPEAPAEHISE